MRSIKSIIALFSICAAVALMLAFTNSITAPIIAEKEAEAVREALREVLPSANDFEKLDTASYDLSESITEAYRADNGGYVFKLKTTGYASGFVIMCGVDAEGKVSGALCISSGETLGYEKTFGGNFVGKNVDEAEKIDTVSGATKTTRAYKEAVKTALKAAEILKGGTANEK